MTPLAGPVHAAALVLAAAGIGKLLRPTGTSVALRVLHIPSPRTAAQLLGVVELAVAVAVLAGIGPAAAAGAAGVGGAAAVTALAIGLLG